MLNKNPPTRRHTVALCRGDLISRLSGFIKIKPMAHLAPRRHPFAVIEIPTRRRCLEEDNDSRGNGPCGQEGIKLWTSVPFCHKGLVYVCNVCYQSRYVLKNRRLTQLHSSKNVSAGDHHHPKVSSSFSDTPSCQRRDGDGERREIEPCNLFCRFSN